MGGRNDVIAVLQNAGANIDFVDEMGLGLRGRWELVEGEVWMFSFCQNTQ